MTNKEFKKLQKENDRIRNELQEFIPFDNSYGWDLINDLIENELQQEEMCNKWMKQKIKQKRFMNIL